MRLDGPWAATLWRSLGLLGLFAAAGLAAGQLLPALLLGLLSLLAWHLYQLQQLERWLRDDGRGRPGETEGVWGDVYLHLYRRQRRHREGQRRLGSLLKQFRKATEAVPDAVVALDPADGVLWCNGASERLLGLRWPQDEGRRITHLVRHPAFVAFLAGTDGPHSLEMSSPVDTALGLSVRVIPYEGEQRLLLAADITRLQRLEVMRRDFVLNVSHELRTPLTVIRGYLEALLDSDDPCAERWQGPLWGMQRQSSRMVQIIEDLLMLSRLEHGHEPLPRQGVAVPALLAAIADDAAALAEDQGHEIRLEVDPALNMLGNEQELRSAFSNLMFNAVRYTPDGGVIVIRWYVDPSGLHMEVEDNGEGIAAHHIPRLTERFYRVDRGRQRDNGGTGLGLAIVKHVVNRHEGRLRINSRLGVGSTFACDFPPHLLHVPTEEPR